MAVFFEFVSIIVRRDAFERAMPANWQSMLREPSNRARGADDEIVRFGSMNPWDANWFVETMVKHGLRYVVDGKAQDVAGVDQMNGITVPCDWLELGTFVAADGRELSACRLVGSKVGYLTGPEGTRLEGEFRKGKWW